MPVLILFCRNYSPASPWHLTNAHLQLPFAIVCLIIIKALRGPGSTVTWGHPFPSSPLPPPLHLPFPPLPQPSPCPLPRSGPKIPKSSYGVWGSAVSSPAWSGAEPQPKSNFVHFSLKIRHLVATILMIFLRVLPKNFLWPHCSGPPGARGPRFIEPPEPPVPTPLITVLSAKYLVVPTQNQRKMPNRDSLVTDSCSLASSARRSSAGSEWPTRHPFHSCLTVCHVQFANSVSAALFSKHVIVQQWHYGCNSDDANV